MFDMSEFGLLFSLHQMYPLKLSSKGFQFQKSFWTSSPDLKTLPHLAIFSLLFGLLDFLVYTCGLIGLKPGLGHESESVMRKIEGVYVTR